MTLSVEHRTARLVLRRWGAEDRPAFAALNADPEVMAHFPSTLDAAASDRLADRLAEELDRRGWGAWAVEVPGVAPFVGFVGLSPVDLDVPFAPAVEVGWRLGRPFWGRGYATEAGRTALEVAFADLGLDEVVSFTVPANRRSRAVMARLGLRHDPGGDFEHPGLPSGHPLRPHVLYRGTAADWRAAR